MARARKRRPVKQGRSRTSVRRAARRTTSKRSPRSISNAIERTERALADLPKGRVRRGPIVVGETRRLTPTGAGWRAIQRELRSVQRATKGKVARRPTAYSFQVSIRYRGPDGRFKSRTLEPAGFPVPAAVRGWMRKYPKGQRGRRKRSLSEQGAFRDLVSSQIIGAVNRTIDEEKDVFGDTDSILAKYAGRGYEAVRRAMKKFKERRGLTVKIKIRREV